jgi:hypothetical protein
MEHSDFGNLPPPTVGNSRHSITFEGQQVVLAVTDMALYTLSS